MAGKKKEGIAALKDTTGGKRRDDRNVLGKTYFDPISVDAKNALTVIYLLQSPEDDVVLRAVASLEGFGRKDPENLKLLCSLGIFDYVFPLIGNKDYIIRRFTLKLIGMLSKLKEFREQMLKVENILKTFTDILRTETDVVLQEFASLTLAELSSEYQAASELLKVESCIETLFSRIISADPDVEKNCLDVMNHLLNDINGIEAFIDSSGFEMKLLLNLVFSSYPVIQVLAIEVLTQLTSWCRDSRVLFAFRDALGIEFMLDILEKEEWPDIHSGALDLLVNVTDCPDICDYLQLSGCLSRLVSLLDTTGEKTHMEKILGILARMSQTKKGRIALHSVEMEERFTNYLEENHDGIQEPSCLGIANLAQYLPSLDCIMIKNPVKLLLEIITKPQKNLNLRNMAAYGLNILSNADERAPEALIQNDGYEGLLFILTDSSNLPTELCQNVIQVFIGISHFHRCKFEIINKNFFSALLSCLPNGDACVRKDASLQVDALECLSEYLIEAEARSVFDELGGAEIMLNCLCSKFASVREWAGHLVSIASQSKDFIKAFIQKDGLEWMLKEKNTMYSMPSWQSAIETIFANFLPAKFAYTGRLDFQDITQDEFYISTNPKTKFLLLDYIIEEKISPIVPIYVADFNLPSFALPRNHSQADSETNSGVSSQISVHKTMEPQNLNKYTKGVERNSLEESFSTFPSEDYGSAKIEGLSSVNLGNYFPDLYLKEHLENLKRKLTKEESAFGDLSWFSIHPRLISERVKIIAQFVADEMSGPESDPICSNHYKEAHITEMKFHLGTNIIPLGLIRMGGFLERAMLFKVLADRIGFPCALVRGPHGRAWIEIAVPVINVEDVGDGSLKDKLNSLSMNSDIKVSSETSVTYDSVKSVSQHSSVNQCPESVVPEGDFWLPKLKLDFFKSFPNQLLKPNAIVDLVKEPGRILRINSFEAEEYCGAFLFGKVNEKVTNFTVL